MLIVKWSLNSPCIWIEDIDFVGLGEYQIKFVLVHVVDRKPDRVRYFEVEVGHDSASVQSVGSFAGDFFILLIEVSDGCTSDIVKEGIGEGRGDFEEIQPFA